MSLDDLGDAGGGPEVGAISVFNRALEQNFQEPLLLEPGQLGGTARNRLGLEGLLTPLTVCVPPSLDGNGRAPQATTGLIERQPPIQKLHRFPPPLLQLLRASAWSHESILH